MKHLVIHNVGPIKSVNVELKRFNFMIGPQSSGKSTIAKILSTCAWVEKEVSVTLNDGAIADGKAFTTLIETFHKMEGYFNESSSVQYETDCIKIDYSHGQLAVAQKKEAPYYRQKICYIPSERNMVTLPELQGFEFSETNIRSFLFDWFNAREYYHMDNKSDILDLDIKYYYDKDEQRFKDRIEHRNGKRYNISLSNASSGLQSIVPLLLILQFYTGAYFQRYGHKVSFREINRNMQLSHALTDSMLAQLHPGFKPEERQRLIEEVNRQAKEGMPDYVAALSRYKETMERLSVPRSTSFIVEEPEQNLFPDTQRALVEKMLQMCRGERPHEFTITTHSPYIVNYLNVLLLRHDKNVSDRISLSPDELTVFSVQNGYLTDQMQTNTATGKLSVNANDLSDAMQEMYAEYKELKTRQR